MAGYDPALRYLFLITNMRIGIDCRTILDPQKGEQAGVGHYTYFLIDNLLKIDRKNEYVLFFDPKIGDAGRFKKKNVKIKFFPFIQYKKFLPGAYSHLLVAGFIDREKVDVFHSPASTIPLAYTKKAVVTIHDLAIYHQPEWFPKGQKFSTKVVVPQTLKRAGKIIAVSEHTKKDIMKFFGTPEKKINVVHNGVEMRKDIDLVKPEDKEAVKKKFDIKQEFILFIGTIQPRKNVDGLVRAFDKLRATKIFTDYQLVIAGGRGWDYEGIFKLVRKLALTKKVIFTDYVTKRDKIRLLNAASLFVFPSLYEGFGLSILEAMQQGTPVITSDITSMPEVAGKAGLLVNPRSVSDIANGIKKVLTDDKQRDKMIRSGYKNAEKFSWEKCAKETLMAYKEVFEK
jgi:glycosyltransferase involved in cell wall biosynthesis